MPAAQSARLLDHDSSVAAWSGYWFGNLQVDGRTVPILGTSPGESVAPPVLTGHGFESPDQIVLGPGTLAQIHQDGRGHRHGPLRHHNPAPAPDRRARPPCPRWGWVG